MKNYILDTNVLLHDPDSLLNFEENSVLLPIEVIEEIDRFKRESSELGQNARAVSRMLDGYRGTGSLSEGVKLPNGGMLKIVFQKNGQTGGVPEQPTEAGDLTAASLATDRDDDCERAKVGCRVDDEVDDDRPQ